jgi:SAM-dependent methyltransferase
MATADDTTTTLGQSHVWDREALGDLYLREVDRWDGTGRRFGEAMLETVGLRPGERVLDVGCGHGTTTFEAARLVAPGGVAVGNDISAPLLDLARSRAAAAGIGNVEFVEGDAQLHPFEQETFDVIISRFGTMFFTDPEAAFANLGRAVRPGGRMAFVAWQDPLKAEWIAVAVRAVAPHVGFPDLGAPGAPGPFAFADGDRLRRIVEAGGFTDVTLELVTKPMLMGKDVADVVGFITDLDQTKALFAGKPEDKVAAAIADLRQGIAPYAGPEGVVMDGTAWLVSARH